MWNCAAILENIKDKPVTSLLASLPLLLLTARLLRRPKRLSKVLKTEERVLILGATSGVGRTLARQYAFRGARVCVVGRREGLVNEVVAECSQARGTPDAEDAIVGVAGDFTSADDMIRVRDVLSEKWAGIDTMIVAAGVSALQPLLAVAGVELQKGTATLKLTTKEGIQHTAQVSSAAIQGNYTGPLVAAVTFIPVLSNTSLSPSILLVSSLAAVIPAPTRSIYASTKASSLLLYQALAIEHPAISFTLFMPSTIEGDFRASAVDKGPVRETNPNKSGLKREAVAKRCIQAVDWNEGSVFMPGSMRCAHLLYWMWPSLVNHFAMKKYNYSV